MGKNQKKILIGILIVISLVSLIYFGQQQFFVTTGVSGDSDELVYQVRNFEDQFRCQKEYRDIYVSIGTYCEHILDGGGNIFSDVVIEGSVWFPGTIGRYPLANSIRDNCQNLGTVDPYPYNGIEELKCNAYCKPNRGICVDLQDGTWESQHCTADGSTIIHDLCPGECVEGSCVGGTQAPQFFIDASLSGSYIFGKDAKFSVDLNVLGSNLVNGQLIQNGQVISEVNQYTTSTGILDLTFQNIQVLGLANVKISATVDGIYKEKMLQVNFQDLPISLTATTQNYQYGDDLLITGNLKVDNENFANALVTGRIIKDGQTIKEATGYTNSLGNVQFSFLDVRVEGSAKLELSTVVNTRQKVYTKTIYFSPIPITIELPSLGDDYIYGSDISVPVVIKYKNVGYPSTTVYGKIKQNGQVISEIVGFTDSEGKADLNFKTVNALGFVDLEVKTNIKGADKTATTSMYFVDVPPIILSIGQLANTYTYGGDITVPINVKLGAEPSPDTVLNVKVISGGSVIKDTSIATDNKGDAIIEFKNLELIGEAQLVVSTTIRGKYKEASSNLFFEGIPLTVSSSTDSYIQYNLEPIKSTINIVDVYGRWISPNEISNIQSTVTLTNGQVLSSDVEYLGSGDYELNSEVQGNGMYSGIVSFNYQGALFSSTAVSIEVRDAILSIDTSQIEPSADYMENGTYQIKISSSLGSLVDPDNLYILVTHPSGFETETIQFNEITKIDTGIYEFNYNNFLEVEKYSFDIFAEKDKYTKGNAKASIAVAGSGGQAGPGWFGMVVQYKWFILVGGVVVVGIILWRRTKRKKK